MSTLSEKLKGLILKIGSGSCEMGIIISRDAFRLGNQELDELGRSLILFLSVFPSVR